MTPDMVFVLAQAPDASTASILNLIGSLGSAGAALAVVWMFLTYLRAESSKRDEVITDITKALRENSESNRQIIRAIEQTSHSPAPRTP